MTRREVVTPARAVAALRPYDAVTRERAEHLAWPGDCLKLDSNESTIDASPLVVSQLADFVTSGGLQWYPDYEATILRQRLAAYTGRPSAEIQVFNGSDGALQCLTRTYVDRDQAVVLASPCYDHLRAFVEAAGASVTYVYGRTLFEPDADAIVGAIGPDTRLVYLANPNNPTGCLYSLGQIEQILERLRHGLLVVDEAYYEFAGVTAAPLLARHGNLAITRSFSKAFSLAGVRCGYLLAPPAIIAAANRVRNGKDVSSLAQTAAVAALDDLPYMRAYVNEVVASREWLAGALRGLGYHVVVTPANFILVSAADPKGFAAGLRACGIYVRDRSSVPRMDGCVRITVGTREQCERVVEAVSAITSGDQRPTTTVAGAHEPGAREWISG
jgi:histidinol-phosphate aminotransferase